MRKNQLLIGFEDENGNTGLILEECAKFPGIFSASDGRTIAHDVTEHINGPSSIGGISDELQALGALQYGRGYFSDFAAGTVSDIGFIFRDWINQSAPENLEFPIVDDIDGMREILEDIKIKARREIIEESKWNDETIEESTINGFLDSAVLNMLQGYYKAAQVYGSHAAASNLFDAVKTAIDKVVTGVDVGMQYTLTYGFEHGEAYAYCEEYYAHDFDEEANED